MRLCESSRLLSLLGLSWGLASDIDYTLLLVTDCLELREEILGRFLCFLTSAQKTLNDL